MPIVDAYPYGLETKSRAKPASTIPIVIREIQQKHYSLKVKILNFIQIRTLTAIMA